MSIITRGRTTCDVDHDKYLTKRNCHIITFGWVGRQSNERKRKAGIKLAYPSITERRCPTA